MQLRHSANERECIVVVNRIQGTDGEISVKYQTIQIDNSPQSAKPGKDYTPTEGTLVFKHQEGKKEIIIPILAHENEEIGEERNEIFGVKLFDANPSAVKISKKNTLIVEIVTDAQRKQHVDALTQLLEKINREERITWGQQFLKATMLHPSKNEDGVIEDISYLDAIFHFFSIGWAILFAFCPPAHWGGGFPCFVAALTFIGLLTALMSEFATVMGCVMGLKQSIVAITFIAIGTSIPDACASMKAARQSNYADAAVANITGANAVNVFFGLGIPWVIAVIYSQKHDQVYHLPSQGLDLTVVLFFCGALLGLAILIFRRCCFKGELGGSRAVRVVSAIVLILIWIAYIVLSILGQIGYISIGLTGRFAK